MSMADVQQVLSQITQLQAELQALSSRVDVLSSSVMGSGFDTAAGAGGSGAEWSKPGFIDTIGGDGEAEPYPYQVRNFGTKEHPSFAIYLPSNILKVAGRDIEVAGDLPSYVPPEDADPEYDEMDYSDWFVLPYSSGRVYLKVVSWYYGDYLSGINTDYSGPHGSAGHEVEDPFIRESHLNAKAEFTQDATITAGDRALGFCDLVEVCNISDGVPYQKLCGALVLPGPPAEILPGTLLADEAVNLLQIYRLWDGRVMLKAPIVIKGTNGIKVTQSTGGWAPGTSPENFFTISLDGDSGGGGSGGDGITDIAIVAADDTALTVESKVEAGLKTFTLGVHWK